MSLRGIVSLLAGFAVLIAILAHQDLSAIRQAISSAGWGLVPALGWRGAAIMLAACAWRSLFVRQLRPQARYMALIRWIGEAVNTMLPVGQVGGDVVRGRLLRNDLVLADHAVKSGYDPATGTSTPHGSHGHGIVGGVSVAATVIVDITLNLFAQLIFALPGLVLLSRLPGFREPKAVTSEIALRSAASGLLGMGIGMTLVLFALSGQPVGIVSTLSSTTPVAILPLLWATTGVRPAPAAWLGAACAVIGAAAIASGY